MISDGHEHGNEPGAPTSIGTPKQWGLIRLVVPLQLELSQPEIPVFSNQAHGASVPGLFDMGGRGTMWVRCGYDVGTVHLWVN